MKRRTRYPAAVSSCEISPAFSAKLSRVWPGRYGLVMVCGGEVAQAAESWAGSPLPTSPAHPWT